MRVTCPECSKVVTAKANARRIKCPSCGFRQDIPEGGLAATTAAWRKQNPKSFVPEGGWPRVADGPDRRTTALAIGAIVLLVAAGVWAYLAWGRGDDASGGEPPAASDGKPELDLITPGVWNVTANGDQVMAWIHNTASTPLAYTWSMTLPEGHPLPPAWNVTFDPPSGVLGPKPQDPAASSNDWARTMVTIRFTDGRAPGEVPVALQAGNASRIVILNAVSLNGTVAKAGESALTHYDLRHSDGRAVQEGDFCVVLGEGTNAVPGYGWGVIGVGVGETVTLVVPPPFAYGYGSHQLANDTLRWTTTVTRIQASCP